MKPQIYCMMTAGKPLNEKIRDVLLINACDMAESGREWQRVKGSDYEGFIESDLEPYCYVGMSIVVFEADVVCPDIGPTKVRYGVRTNDLNEGVLAKGRWGSMEDLVREFHPEMN